MISIYSEKDLIIKAMNTTNSDLLSQLSTSPYSNVRRAVAKNPKTTIGILEKLQYDPVLNVSYIANGNPNIRKKRDLAMYDSHPCVNCQKEPIEMILSCFKCNK